MFSLLVGLVVVVGLAAFVRRFWRAHTIGTPSLSVAVSPSSSPTPDLTRCMPKLNGRGGRPNLRSRPSGKAGQLSGRAETLLADPY